MKRYNIKNSKGITLIALIITIIVLLILSTIVITSILGNESPIEKAGQARNLSEKGEIQDMLTLTTSQINLKSYEEQKEKLEYYKDKETFLQNIDVSQYRIDSYNLKENTQIELKIEKENGTNNAYEFEIDITTGKINFTGELQQVGESQQVIEEKEIESNTEYFIWSENSEYAQIVGLSESWNAAYEADAEDIINLVIPSTYNGKNNIVISNNIFKNLKKIKRLVIPDSVSNIGYGTFYGCSELEEIKIPISINSAKNNGYYDGVPFYNCTNINKVTFTKGTGIGYSYTSGEYVFTPWYISRNNQIDIKLADGITQIGERTFLNCPNIKILNFPTTIKTVKLQAFSGCTNIQIDAGKLNQVTEFGNNAFYGCQTLTGTLTISNQITQLASYCFVNTGLTKIILHEGVTDLGYGTFYGCTSLNEITVPISVNTAKNNGYYEGVPFYNCTNINKVTLTKGTGIGCSYTSGECIFTPWYIARNNQMDINLADGITQIGERTFLNCPNMKISDFPTTITTIKLQAFSGCTNIQIDAEKLNQVTEFGNNAFYGCQTLVGTLTISNQITQMSSYCFVNTGLTKLILHDGVTDLGYGTFCGCTSLNEITVPISLNTAKNNGYYDGVPFYRCTNINKVTLTKGTGIGCSYTSGEYVFTPWYIAKSNSIDFIINKEINSIGSRTFMNLTSFNIYYKGTETEWNQISIDSTNMALSNITYNYQ